MEQEKSKKEKKNEKIEALEEKIKILEEESLRAKAELINYRKRKDDEVSNMLKYANADLLNALLPVVDNFERAIKIDDNNLNDELSQFLSGFKMIYAGFREILLSFGVKEIECLGQKFDSKYENCLFTDCDNTKEDEVVLDVLMKGYTYNDKILRCASVKVNKIDVDENKNIEKESECNE